MRFHAPGIQYFDAVRHAGSICGAARLLNVASSAVNRQVLKLEAELGVPLFERVPGGVKLSAAGEMLARHVTLVLRDAERVQSDLAALKGAQTGRVLLTAVEGVSADFLPVVLGEMLRGHPQIRTRVMTAGSSAVARAVATGDYDVGIAFSLPQDPSLRQLAVGRFRIGAVMVPGHCLAGQRTVTVDDCMDVPLIMSDPLLSIHGLLQPLFVHARRPLRTMVEAHSIELMKNLALRGLGICFQSRIGIEDELASGRLLHVPLHARGPVFTELGVYVRADAPLPVAVDAFIRYAATELQQREAAERAVMG